MPAGSSTPSRIAAEIREYDWAATPLGPIETWPASLRHIVDFMLASPQLASVAVGPQRILIYNDVAATHYGANHPRALGRPLAETFDEYPMVAGFYDRAFGGESVHVPAQPLDPSGKHRDDVYEAFLTPIRDEAGLIVAVHMSGIARSGQARAEAALRESEARYRALFESMDEAYAVIDVLKDGTGHWADFRFVEINPAFMVHTGMPYPVGQTATELLGAPNPRWTELYGQVLDTGETLRVEESEATLGITFDLNIFALDRTHNRVAVLFTNITNRKQAERELRESEERQAFLLKFSDTLRAEPDAHAMARRAIALLSSHMNLDRCYITYYQPDDDLAEFPYQIGNMTVPPLPATVRLSDFPDAYEQVLDKTFVTEDDFERRGLSEIERANSAALGMRAMVASTIRHGEKRPLASLAAVCSRPRRWTTGEVALVEEIAERTWSAMEQGRAEVALRESEERQRLTIELVPALLWSASFDGQEVALNEGWSVYTGQSETETQSYGWLNAVHPDDLPATRAAFEHAFATGELLERKQRIRKAGNGYRWHLVRHVPVRDEQGAITRWFGAAVDIHESKLAEQALQETERRLQTLVEGVPQLVWRASDPGIWTWASPQWTDYTGQAESDSHGWNWLAPVHPDDREQARERWNDAKHSGRFEADYRIFHVEEQRYRWFQTRAMPVHDADGAIIEWLGTSTDVDDLRGMRDRQQMLVAELQHRVRNILTIVRSVFQRTVEADGPIDAMIEHFRGRLDNLARTQVIVTQSAGGQVDLRNLIVDELMGVGVVEGPNIIIDGLDVAMDSQTGETISLAIHELTTNAVKYGALKIDSATLTVQWSVKVVYGEERRLDLTWIEQGVPAVPLKPARHGFGSELIEEAIPYRLGGETTLEFRGGGVRCTISVPLPDTPASDAWEDQ